MKLEVCSTRHVLGAAVALLLCSCNQKPAEPPPEEMVTTPAITPRPSLSTSSLKGGTMAKPSAHMDSPGHMATPYVSRKPGDWMWDSSQNPMPPVTPLAKGPRGR